MRSHFFPALVQGSVGNGHMLPHFWGRRIRKKSGMDPLQGRFDGEKSDSRAKGGFCRPGLQAGTLIARCLKYKKA